MATLITSANQLLAIPQGSTGSYELGNNITLSQKSATPSLMFNGVLDGKGYSISYSANLADSIRKSGGYGLFGTTDGATIRNLKLNCHVRFENTASYSDIGGLIGIAKNTRLENIEATILIQLACKGYTSNIGGLIGNATDCTLKSIKCKGDVARVEGNSTGYSGQGGLAGSFIDCTLENIYSKMNLSRPKLMAYGDYTGGISGRFYRSSIKNFEIDCDEINMGRYGSCLFGYVSGTVLVENGAIKVGTFRIHYGNGGTLLYNSSGVTINNISFQLNYAENYNGGNIPIKVSGAPKISQAYINKNIKVRKYYSTDAGNPLVESYYAPLIKIEPADFLNSKTTFDSTLGQIEYEGTRVFKLKNGETPHLFFNYYDVPIYIKNSTHYFKKSGSSIQETIISEAEKDLSSFNQIDVIGALTKSDLDYLENKDASLVSSKSRTYQSDSTYKVYYVLYRDIKSIIKDYNSPMATIKTVEVI